MGKSLKAVTPVAATDFTSRVFGADPENRYSNDIATVGTQLGLGLGSRRFRPGTPNKYNFTGKRNLMASTATGLAMTPALNLAQGATHALSQTPAKPVDPDEKPWAGAPYRLLRNTAVKGVSNLVGPPEPDKPDNTWRNVALGGGAAALLAALLYRTMGSNKAEDDEGEEG